MVHPQPITQLCTYSTTANVPTNDTIKQQQSRTMNMCYFWIRDQNIFKNFLIAWKSGQENIAYYFTKHHSVKHHKGGGVLYIPRQIKRHRQSCLYYLSRPCKSVLIQRIPIWNNSSIHSPFLEYHELGEPGNRQRIEVPQKDAKGKL